MLVKPCTKVKKRYKIDFILSDLPKLLDSNINGLVRVRDVVSDLMAISRPADSSKEEKIINIHDSLNIIINLLSHKLTTLKIDLIKDFNAPESCAQVKASASKLDQVWMNLILNAIQAIEEKKERKKGMKGKIIVRTHCEKNSIIRIEIEDNGKGIPAENKQKIFWPFFTTKESTKGTGLGLSICLRIVQEFGGAIGIFSEEGEGTKVVVSFPIMVDQ